MSLWKWENLKKGLKNPKLAVCRISGIYANKIFGQDCIQKDWDNLVILDACRFDIFADVHNFNPEVHKCTSNASSSIEFMRRNFADRDLRDTVYFTANPHISEIESEFFDIIPLWETDWDEEKGTVRPEDAIDRVLELKGDYMDKRIIIHLMQPHRPFLGPTSDSICQDGLNGVRNGGDGEYGFWWRRLEKGTLSRKQVWQAYRETLEVTLPEVQRLTASLAGKTAITADHGNAFGEDGIYGHPKCTYHWTLVKVPWLEISGDRRQISKGNKKAERKKISSTEERLEALGYM